MEVCVDCKKFISEIINSSRRSLSLANKRARLKRKTQSFYMSSPGTSEYCPSERTINEIWVLCLSLYLLFMRSWKNSSKPEHHFFPLFYLIIYIFISLLVSLLYIMYKKNQKLSYPAGQRISLFYWRKTIILDCCLLVYVQCTKEVFICIFPIYPLVIFKMSVLCMYIYICR